MVLLKRKGWGERHYLYIIGLKDEGVVLPHAKIGISGNVQRRIAGMSTSQPFELFCHMQEVFKNEHEAQKAEYHAHTALAHIRGRGEWFKAYPDELEKMVRDLWANPEPLLFKYALYKKSA